jgi:hypothetical protein
MTPPPDPDSQLGAYPVTLTEEGAGGSQPAAALAGAASGTEPDGADITILGRAQPAVLGKAQNGLSALVAKVMA